MRFFLLPVTVLNQHVMPVVSTRNIGVCFYDAFYFSEHISQIC